MAAAAERETPAPPHRRWLRRSIILVAVLSVLAAFAVWLLQPQRSVPALLDRVGDALGLEIVASGTPEARLRGTPQLVVRDVIAREPGGGRELFRAERVLIALPWSTLRSRGDALTVRRVELDAPRLNLAVLQDWLAKRPPGEETRIPTLTDGLTIRDGRLDGEGWWIEGIALDLPSLHPRQALRARIQGRYADDATRLPFDLTLALSRPENGAGLGLAGRATVERDGWRLPAVLVLSGPLRLGGAPNEAPLALAPARFGASAEYVAGETRLPFKLGLAGPLRWQDASLQLSPAGMALSGGEAMPSFQGRAALAVGERLRLRLDGALPDWPAAWPALPAPIGASRAPLPFALEYEGAPNLSDEIALRLARDAMRFDARFRIDDILAWMSTQDGSPLPPLDGRLSAPQLDISGAVLEEVEIEVSR